MLVLALFMQAATPAARRPAPTPTPAIYESDDAPRPTIALPTPATRTLSDVARERRGKPKPAGSFSASGLGSGPTPTPEIDPSGYLVRRMVPTAAATAAATPSTSEIDKLEAAWRGRFKAASEKLAHAESELAKMEKAIPETVCTGPGCNRGATGAGLAGASTTRDAALAPYRSAVGTAKEELSALQTECRTTVGCQPGWVR